MLPETGILVSADGREREMTNCDDELRVHRLVAMLFALLAGMSAVSTAVAPAIMHF
jgi:hypothetical protein